MAEIGLIASIIGVVSTGAKLSLVLFDFASAIGNAGAELQLVGTEVSLFCSVVQQLRGVVTNANFQFSKVAIESAQAIMDRCEEIFDEIDDIVGGLQRSQDAGTIPSVDFVGRVKWTFKKSKVQVLRSTLDSCKITMLIMLTTGEFAQKVSLRRISNKETAAEDEQDTLMAQSLIVSQQYSIQQLSVLEDQADQESKLTRVLGLDHGMLDVQNTVQHNSLSRMLNGLSVNDGSLTRPQTYPTRAQRASVWLSSMIIGNDDDSSNPHPGVRKRRISSIDAADRPIQLLRKWTNLGDYMDQPPKIGERKLSNRSIWTNGSFSFKPENRRPKLGVSVSEDPRITRVKRIDTDAISPTTDTDERSRSLSLAASLAFTEASVSAEQQEHSCSQVLGDLLQKYGVTADRESQRLCIAYGGQIRVFQEDAKPLATFQHFRELGLEPQLLVQNLDANPNREVYYADSTLDSTNLSFAS